nr:transposase [Streptomyces sp. WAC01526]
MNRQLTVQESRHKPARDICHGKRGQIMQAYREGQKDQLGVLGLVLNAAVLRTIRNLDAAVEQLRALPPEERGTTSWTSTLSSSPRSSTRTSTCWAAGRPLRGGNSIRASVSVDGGLRPLRDPASPTDE